MDIEVGEAGWRNEAFAEDNKGKMLVFFHTVQKKNNFETAKQKRPVFVEKIHIKKLIPGDSKLIIDRPMRESDMEEFPVEWARFEQKKSAVATGTPIAAWGILSETQQAEFRALNIFTVDQFANLPDSSGHQIMGFNDLRAKARAFLMASKDSEMMDRVRLEMEQKLTERDKEMEALRAQIAALSAAPARKKPGPKAKIEATA